MIFDIITLFPDFFTSPLGISILGRAQKNKLITVRIHNLRDFGLGNYKQVDDTPYGGGAGMVMRPEPLFDAIQKVKKQNKGPVVYFTPQGKKLTQAQVERFHKIHSEYIIICDHYEGVDYRIREHLVDYEISVGDYVVSGGELPALIFIDSLTRLIPGALGTDESSEFESFSKAFKRKKEHPHYTKPATFHGWDVPEILLSGNHQKIEEWRKKHLK